MTNEELNKQLGAQSDHQQPHAWWGITPCPYCQHHCPTCGRPYGQYQQWTPANWTITASNNPTITNNSLGHIHGVVMPTGNSGEPTPNTNQATQE